MDERELISWLRKQVGRRIPAEVIRRLRADGYLHTENDSERDEALSRTQFLLDFDPPQSTRLKLPSDRALRLLAERDVQRRDAVSEYWARDAERQPAVRRFRDAALGGVLLTPGEARTFLASPAALMFGVDELLTQDIDPARHIATIKSEDARFLGPYRAVVEVTSPPVELEFKVATSSSNPWDGVRPQSAIELAVQGEDGGVVTVHPWPGSAVDDLRSASMALKRYAWREGEAAWFILTGTTPPVVPFGHTLDWRMGSLGNRAVIKLEIEPWISVERVAYVYATLQQRILGGHNRIMSERRIALFRFVTQRADDDGEAPPWRTLMDEWNEARGTRWRYENVRNFARDYRAAARGMLFPKYRFW